jgi:isoquinoline 1-oxidoreductase beta subunit
MMRAPVANEINAWIVIDPDETITIRIPHTEMGQGAGTRQSMLVAEELECDWAKIKGEFASPNRNVRENNCYKDQNTGRFTRRCDLLAISAAGRGFGARAPGASCSQSLECCAPRMHR